MVILKVSPGPMAEDSSLTALTMSWSFVSTTLWTGIIRRMNLTLKGSLLTKSVMNETRALGSSTSTSMTPS